MTLENAEFAAIDFESAGVLRGHTDVPIQVGIALMRGRDVKEADFFVSYLRADRPVAWTARQVHGISSEETANAPGLLELWPEFRSRLAGRIVVCHGASTEKRFLRAFPFHGFGPWIDTLELHRSFHPGEDSYSLSSLAHRANLEADCFALLPNFRWHDALSDAVATLLLLRSFITRNNLWHQDPAQIARD